MFSVNIDKDTIKEIRDFLDSDDCDFVQNMTQANLSFPAMALIINAIVEKCDEVEKKLNEEE